MVKLTEQKIQVDRTLMIKAATQMVSYTSTDLKKKKKEEEEEEEEDLFFLMLCLNVG